jgi:transglutaminase-like putative cysteine protease
MKYFNFMLMAVLFTTIAHAQQNYEVSLINKELLSHASAVILTNETEVNVKSMDYVTQHVKYAVTVLNKNGEREAGIYLYYDKINQVRSVKGTIYDEFGKPIARIAERQLTDHAAADGFSLFTDSRYKSYRPAVTTFPYTVEYDYELSSKQTLFLPDWEPNSFHSTGTSVQHSSYKLNCKPDFIIRYKTINFPGKVTESEVAGLKTYSWVIDNVKALRYEPYSPDEEHLLPSVKIAPNQFYYEGIKGKFTNWEEYGGFVFNDLVKNRQVLPAETIARIKDLTKDITDAKLKAKKVYEYVQQKVRYVSVQIGIGGYQPFLASDVDQTSYGDCKALVNYTQALLSAVGIPSYYVLNMAGTRKVSAMPDFASMNQFNHVILCLPFKNDTTWVDCTSKELPFGYIGDFTDDRNVIACTPAGGILLHTPVYKTVDNKQLRKANFALAGDGTLKGEMVTRFEGSQYDNREELVAESQVEQFKKLKEIYPIENLEIEKFELKQEKSLKPATTETIKLQAHDYMAKNGSRYFFTPNTASRYIKPLKDVTNRVNPVYINRGYVDEDEISFTLPLGSKISTRPLQLTIDKPFGKYVATTQVIGDKLLYKRKLQLNQGTYDKDSYADLVDFYQSVYDADGYTLTMEKE